MCFGGSWPLSWKYIGCYGKIWECADKSSWRHQIPWMRIWFADLADWFDLTWRCCRCLFTDSLATKTTSFMGKRQSAQNFVHESLEWLGIIIQLKSYLFTNFILNHKLSKSVDLEEFYNYFKDSEIRIYLCCNRL